MSSQANKDQFLKQFEQIVEGIKQNRVKVCSPIVKPQTVTVMWGYLSFFCLPLSLLLSLPSFCLLRMIFFFCALYWWDQNTLWFKIWCLHKIWCFQDPFHVPWKLWKVWFGRIASDRDRWLFDVKTVKMVHWSVMHELRLITVGTGYCPVMVHWSVSLELNSSWWLWARVTIIMSWFTDLWHMN